MFVAARRMVWMICCLYLFPGFWNACNADILSLRIVADSIRVLVDLGRRREILLIMLIPYKTPISSAACIVYRSIGPT